MVAEVGASRMRGDTCDEVLQGVAEPPNPNGPDTIAALAEQIRTGDVPDGSVSVAIAEDSGTVTITWSDVLVPVPVEAVDGAWLVADATTLLFGVGNGGN